MDLRGSSLANGETLEELEVDHCITLIDVPTFEMAEVVEDLEGATDGLLASSFLPKLKSFKGSIPVFSSS